MWVFFLWLRSNVFLVKCGLSGRVSTIQQPVIMCVSNECFSGAAGGEGGLPPWSCLWFKKKTRNASWNKIRFQTCSYSLKAGNDKAAIREHVCVLCLCGGHSAFSNEKVEGPLQEGDVGNYIKQAQEVELKIYFLKILPNRSWVVPNAQESQQAFSLYLSAQLDTVVGHILHPVSGLWVNFAHP